MRAGAGVAGLSVAEETVGRLVAGEVEEQKQEPRRLPWLGSNKSGTNFPNFQHNIPARRIN